MIGLGTRHRIDLETSRKARESHSELDDVNS